MFFVLSSTRTVLLRLPAVTCLSRGGNAKTVGSVTIEQVSVISMIALRQINGCCLQNRFDTHFAIAPKLAMHF